MKQYKGDLSFDRDYYDDVQFTVTFVDSDLEQIERYKAILASDPSIYEVTFFFYGIDLVNEDTGEERLDYGIVHVSIGGVRVTGRIKHDISDFSTGFLTSEV